MSEPLRAGEAEQRSYGDAVPRLRGDLRLPRTRCPEADQRHQASAPSAHYQRHPPEDACSEARDSAGGGEAPCPLNQSYVERRSPFRGLAAQLAVTVRKNMVTSMSLIPETASELGLPHQPGTLLLEVPDDLEAVAQVELQGLRVLLQHGELYDPLSFGGRLKDVR